MAWFRVDDSFYDHPKVFDAPDVAIALWTRAGCWAARNLTNGFVPEGMPRRLCDDPDLGVKELVGRGLWEITEGGYRFHDWKDSQPLREQVLADRAAASRRQALTRNPDLRDFVRRRDDNTCRYCGQVVDWKDRRSTSGGTFDHVDPQGPTNADNVVVACRGCSVGKSGRAPEQAGMRLLPQPGSAPLAGVSRYAPRTDLDSSLYPTRPDPARPVLPSEVLEEGTSSASPPDDPPTKKITGKRGTRLPAGFQATPEMIEWARSNTPNVGLAETEAFIDHFTAAPGQKGIKTDWVATWRNWMRREQKHITEQRQRRGPASPAGSGAQNRGPIPADERCPTHRGQRKATCGPCRSERHGRTKEVA